MFDNIRFLKNVHKVPYTQREFKKLLEDAPELSENTREYMDANSKYQMSSLGNSPRCQWDYENVIRIP